MTNRTPLNDRKIALITGINGQVGSFLADFLIAKKYEVHGIIRQLSMKDSANGSSNISHLLDSKSFNLHEGNTLDGTLIKNLIQKINPTEIYHLAGQSNIPRSFENPWDTLSSNVLSTINLLEAIKELNSKIKFYFAGSSEVFGDAETSPQNEETQFNPRSPYGISKTTGYYFTKLYREKFQLFACSGICYNHESERRNPIFATRKITQTVSKIKHGLATELRLGNLDARKDWGYTGDFVEAMWLMLQQNTPTDFVIGTGVSHTIRQFVKMCFNFVELDWKKYVIIDDQLLRTEKNLLVADSSKSERILGWKPKTTFDEIVAKMMENDLNLVQRQFLK